MAKIKKGMSTSNMVAVGVGAATVAVAAVGAYWFYGSNDASKHRKSARSWMLKARGEVLEAVENVIEKVGEIDKEKYMSIVEDVLKRYSKLAGVTQDEMAQMTRDMKAAWQHMQKARKSSVSKIKKAVKNTMKTKS